MTHSFPTRRSSYLHLVSLVADRLWLVKDGAVRAYDGDIEDYKREVLDAARSGGNNRRSDAESVAPQAPRLSGKEARKARAAARARSEEHTSELQSLMRTSYAVFCLNKKKDN